MKKRILSLLLALVMLLGLLPTVALASGGVPTTKTAEDGKTYYLIEDEADLKWFRDQVNGGKGTINAKLTADITLTEANWTPIGKAADYSAGVYEANAFKGIFDGNRKTISGLKIDCTASSSVALGLFGVANGATIKNLVVRGEIKATLNKTSSATFEIGGVVGQCGGATTLNQVVSYVNVTSTNNNDRSSPSAVGGLLGNGYNATIINCVNYGTVTSTDSADGDYNRASVGGLSAMSPYGGKITIWNSLSLGTVTGPYAAGLISVAGTDYSGNTSSINNSATVGKTVGMGSGTFANCYETEESDAKATKVDSLTDDAVLAALNAGDNGNAFVKGDDGLPVLSWMKSGGSDTPLAEPKWNEGGYYEIETAQQLGWLRDQVNAGNLNNHSDFSAKLMNDITLDGDWEPMGKGAYGGNPYYGEFDGQGHKITGLSITQNGTDDMILGLFGSVGKSSYGDVKAKICNLTVEGEVSATILPTSNYNFAIAGVAAYSNGQVTLQRVISKVNVTCDSQNSNAYSAVAVAGLLANAQSSDVITECANYGTITSTDVNNNGNVAGLVTGGWGSCSAKVEYSFNAGTITGADNVAGIVGQNTGSITACYNTGKVTATKTGGKAGGLTAENGTITNAYSIGNAIGKKGGKITNCYETEASPTGSGVTLKTRDALKDMAVTISGSATAPVFTENKPYTPKLYWEGEYPACEHKGNKTDRYVPLKDQPGQHMHDILCEICGEKAGQSTVETCVKGKDGTCVCGYQFCDHTNQKTTYASNDNGTHEVIVTCEDCKQQLSKTTGNCVKGADGTCEKCGYMFPPDAPELKDGFYQITKEAELKWFRNEINKGNHTIKGKLLDNITLTDAWTPIGTSESHFVGSFDGNGKTISGLHFDVQNTPEESLYLGLFGYVGGNQDSAAEIRDLTVSGEIRVAAGAARSVLAGGVVAYLDNHSKLSGVVSTVTVNIQADGSTAGSIIGRTNNSASNITVENCANHGDVTVNGTVGGILGQSSGSSKNMLIRGCYNDGTISGSDRTGGLIGSVQSGMEPGFGDKPTVYHTVVTDSYNAGAVTGTGSYTGGLIGENRQAQIRNCYNAANVRGAQKAGGLAGRHHSGSMEYCYSIGEVTGASGYMGTLIGQRGDNINVRGLYAIAEPMIGDGDNDYIQKNQLVRKIDLVTLRQLPKELNTNQAFQIAPGKTPILIWQVVPACQHPENKKGFAYVAILNDNGTASGKHTKQLICEDCFHVFEQAAEDCTEGEDHSCTYCGAVLCNHSDTPENKKTYTYVMGSAEQGRWMHRVRFTCVTCGRELDYTEDCDIEIEYKPISGKEGERHQVLKKCKFHSGRGGYAEACVDGGDDGKTFDGNCDRCGAKLTKVLPAVQPGSGFEDYTSIEGKQEVTRYTVTHYEIGAEAEALTVVAASGNGSVPTYQWYYRMQEDAIDKDGNPIAGTPIPDATSSSFTPDTSAETEMRFYYCVVSNSTGGTATSPAQPVIVCENPTVTAYFSLTNDDKYVIGNGNGGGSGKVMAFQQVTVPYFDLGLYGLQSGYFRSETYGPQNPNDQMGGSALSAGTSATAYGKITDLHLMIYMLERHYCGLTDEQCGKGYLYKHDLMGKGSTVLEPRAVPVRSSCATTGATT